MKKTSHILSQKLNQLSKKMKVNDNLDLLDLRMLGKESLILLLWLVLLFTFSFIYLFI